jgi:outer membrane protein OmpA-like peptidoglycan-associated protein
MKKYFSCMFVSLFFILSSFAQERDSVTINFGFNKYDITSAGAAKLDSLVLHLNSLPVAFIEINGHCDTKGSDGYNDTLSLKRVQSIHDYLKTKNLSSSVSFIDRGFGKRQLLNDEPSEQAQSMNRRVDIIITYKPEEKVIEAPPVKTVIEFLADSSSRAGNTIALPNMQFKPGSPTLLPSSEPGLKEVLTALQNNPRLKIRIEGHICCRPETEDDMYLQFRMSLSEQRAKTVYKYLLANGIAADRLSFKGFGSTQPIFPLPERSEEQRIANRRVEIRIIEK